MTAIAYVFPFLAADSLITDNDRAVCWLDKVKEVRNDKGVWLLTGAGECGAIEKFFAWAEDRILGRDHDTDSPPITDGVAIMVDPDGNYYEYTADKCDGPWRHSNGWGYSHFITGALEAGATAADAVKAACARLITCGGPIKVYQAGVGHVETLPEPPKVVKLRGSYVDTQIPVPLNANIEWHISAEEKSPAGRDCPGS